MPSTQSRLALIAFIVSLISGCATSPMPLTIDEVRALVSAPDRSPADKEIDTRRNPLKLVEFYGLGPGMRVLDLSAGRGYNAELIARGVRPNGKVYAHNTPDLLKGPGKEAFDQRLKTPAAGNIVPIMRVFDDPIPSDLGNLDLVTFNFNYHDLGWIGTDRTKLNNAVFNALKRGGVYIVADHSGRPGTGITESKTLHRVEESFVRREIEAAGFRFVSEGGFLRNSNDPRDKPVFKPAQLNDEFVLKFVKP